IGLDDITNTGRPVIVDAGAAITDGNGGDTINILASTAELRAGTGIGSGLAGDAGDIDSTVTGDLAAQTDSGDINLHNVGGLTIGSLGTIAGVEILDTADNNNGEDITVRAASPLTINSPVVNNAGGDIVLAAEGNTVADDMTINANITASGGNGNISLFAGHDVLHNAGTISAAGAGAINVSAGEDLNGGGANQAGNADADVTMADGVTISSASGTIEVEATTNIELSILTTSGDVTVSADDNDFTLANNVGAITDVLGGEGTGNVNITGAALDLDAATGIGGGTTLGSADIDIDGVSLSAVNSTSGTINIAEVNNIALDDVTNVTRAVILDAGAAISDNNAATNNITADTLEIQAGAGIGSGNSLETDINTLAASNGATAGNIEIDNVDAGNALLTLDTVGTLHGAVNTSAGGTIVITNNGAITVADNGSAADDVAADGDITLDAADPRIAGSIDNLVISANADIVSANGNITLEAGDDLTQFAGGVISAATGIITMDVDLPSGSDPDGGVNLTGSTVTILGSLTTAAGTFITGGDDNDIFNILPQSGSAIMVDGNPPVMGGPGDPPGDTLNLDATGLANAFVDLIPTTSGFVGVL
ncbi:MAG: hypothetical protein GY903_28790, partial [Fuerstiella sp.]|nr:hypothetical protein [Fuerstiella sp.]